MAKIYTIGYFFCKALAQEVLAIKWMLLRRKYLELENGRSTPGSLTVQSDTTVSTKKTRRTLMK